MTSQANKVEVCPTCKGEQDARRYWTRQGHFYTSERLIEDDRLCADPFHNAPKPEAPGVLTREQAKAKLSAGVPIEEGWALIAFIEAYDRAEAKERAETATHDCVAETERFRLENDRQWKSKVDSARRDTQTALERWSYWQQRAKDAEAKLAKIKEIANG